MNDKHKNSIEQLLSAYFDGEATEVERIEAERALENSVEARRELGELEQLSGLLQNLPREAAPVALSESVLAQTCRIHSENVRPVASASSRMAWMKYVAGFVATAAALFIITLFLPRPGEEMGKVARQPNSNMNANEEIAALHGDAASRRDVSESRNGVEKDFAKSTLDNAKLSGSKVASQSGSPMKGVRGGGSGGANAPSVNAKAAAGQARASVPSQHFSAKREELASFRRTNWDGVKIGDILSYQDESGDQVVVVEVTVVDIHQAVDEMQLLLTKNSIPDVTITTKSEAKQLNKLAASDKSTGYKNIPTQQLALLVKTSKSQLATTFNQLQNKSLFVDLQPQSNVSLAGVQIASLDNRKQLAQLKEVLRDDSRMKLKRSLQHNAARKKADIKPRTEKPVPLVSKKQPRGNKPADSSDDLNRKKPPSVSKSVKPESKKLKPPFAEKSEVQMDGQLASSYQFLLQIDKPKLSRYSNSLYAQQSKADAKRNAGKAKKSKQAGKPVEKTPAITVAEKEAQTSPGKKGKAPELAKDNHSEGNRGRHQRTNEDKDRSPQNDVRVLFVFTQQPAPAGSAVQKARTP